MRWVSSGTFYGPVAVRLIEDLITEYRATLELARRQRYLESHPPEWPFSVKEPEMVRMGMVAYGIADLKPRFGIRFAGPRDTTDILLDTVDSLRIARLAFRWWDTSGRRARAFARMPFSFVGDPDADSTLRKLQRPATRL